MEIPGILAMSIPIVAIITFGVTLVVKILIRHRERMAMIEMGMHPDYPPDEYPVAVPAPDAGRPAEQSVRSVAEPAAKAAVAARTK